MKAPRSQSGFAMLAMLLAMALIVGLVGNATARTRLLARGTVLDRGKVLTLHAASGGLSLARHAIAKHPSYRGEELTIGGCKVKIESTPMPEDDGKRWQVVVTATHHSFGAKMAPVRHRIDAVLETTEGLPTVLAFRDNGR